MDSETELHDHHIFPKRLAKSHNIPQELLDSIVNRIPLIGESNRKLSDREPRDYFSELLHTAQRTGTIGDLKRRLYDSMIPGNPEDGNWLEQFSIERFHIFLENRAILLLDRIKELIGDSLFISELSPDMAAEED